jgi:hypothetical protein
VKLGNINNVAMIQDSADWMAYLVAGKGASAYMVARRKRGRAYPFQSLPGAAAANYDAYNYMVLTVRAKDIARAKIPVRGRSVRNEQRYVAPMILFNVHR